MRVILALLLMLEALWTVPRLAGLVPTIAAYDPVALVVIAARGLVGAMQLISGWLLLNRRPPAATLARAALLASAALLTLEAGARLAPSGVYPFWRWQIVGTYWAYAIAASIYLTHVSKRYDTEGTEGTEGTEQT